MKRKLFTIALCVIAGASTLFAVEYIRGRWHELVSGSATLPIGGNARVESVYIKFDSAYSGDVKLYATLLGEEVLRTSLSVSAASNIVIVPEGLIVSRGDSLKVECDPAGDGKTRYDTTK